MMSHSQHALILGGTHVDGIDATWHPDGYRFAVAADGLEFGSAEAVESVVRAFAEDGSVARIEGHDNAETTFRLLIEGQDHTALNRGEAAFRRLLPDGYGGTTDLVERPPDGHAPASVRTILTGSFAQEYDDEALLRCERVYTVTLTHLPFVRSEFETVAPVLPAPSPQTVTIDSCESTAGWAASPGAAPVAVSTSGGALHFSAEAASTTPGGFRAWNITRTSAPLDLTGTPFIAIEAKFPVAWGAATRMFLRVAGAFKGSVSQEGVSDGYTRLTFYAADLDGSATMRILADQNDAGTGAGTLSIRSIEAATSPESRQGARVIEVGGTERTPGSLHIAARDGASPLGLVVAHTSPDAGVDHNPDLARWVTDGPGFVRDITAPMGGYREMEESATSVIRCRVPAASLPTSTYQIALLVRPYFDGRAGFGWMAGTSARPDSDVATSYDSGEVWVDLVEGRDALVAVGTTTLPTAVTAAGSTVISISKHSGGVVRVRGMWLFQTGRDCGLTAVSTDEPNLWIDTATASESALILTGEAADQSDAYAPSGTDVFAATPHIFRAGKVAAYVVTSEVDHPASEFRHHRRWPYNAADDGTDQ
ncbi:hypothetical protein [Microbacterium sp.]|uniref:hypothetical protein n=1 Tax=Microbacterium sp. TaxID=51671 RepID=UPI0037354792